MILTCVLATKRWIPQLLCRWTSVKKRHTLKSQVVIDQETKEIICTAHDKGKEHDFRWFKTSKVRLKKKLPVWETRDEKLHPIVVTQKEA